MWCNRQWAFLNPGALSASEFAHRSSPLAYMDITNRNKTVSFG